MCPPISTWAQSGGGMGGAAPTLAGKDKCAFAIRAARFRAQPIAFPVPAVAGLSWRLPAEDDVRFRDTSRVGLLRGKNSDRRRDPPTWPRVSRAPCRARCHDPAPERGG